MDIAECRPAHPDCCRNIAQSALHQHNICSINGNICSRSNRDSYICSRQSRSIIDPISDHCHLSFFLQWTDHCLFSFRQHTCNDFIHSCLLSDCFCGTLIISGQHNHPDSHILQFFYCLWTVFFDDICNRNDSDQFLIFYKEQRSLSLLCKLLCLLLCRIRYFTFWSDIF